MKILYKNNPYLKRLEKIMNFNVEGKMPSAAFLFHRLYALLAVGYSMIMTPIMIWCLIKLRRYGWVGAFFLLIFLPIISANFFVSSQGFSWILIGSGIMSWVVYTAVLKATIPDWKEPIFINRKNTD